LLILEKLEEAVDRGEYADLTDKLAQVLEQCLARDMKLLLILCCVGVNGRALNAPAQGRG
jgi:hypothetical protein